VRLDDPDVVATDYASEATLLARRSVYETSEGPNAVEVVFGRVADAEPRDVLEVGPGPGELSERISHELGANVVAVDVSPRMVELTRARGVDARVGDVQELPFETESFDLVVAAWVLFHPADLDRALAEIARVLRPGGRLVAATNSERHLEELWKLVGAPRTMSSFSSETAEAALRPHFDRIDVDHVEGWVIFPDTAAVRDYVANSIICAHFAEHVPVLDAPLRARRRAAVFVAEKAA
jgi:SAM-dependent methyltransferase